MVINKTDDFLASVEKLPNDAKRILKRQEEIQQLSPDVRNTIIYKLFLKDNFYAANNTRTL
ncbi:MAG: hypothetical protein AAB071_04035 [Bacteroidota bacterium]